MTPSSRSTSLLVARTSLAVLMLSFAVFVVWTAGDLLGQPPAQKKPRTEEEEEPPKTKAKAGKNKQRAEEEEEAAPRQKPKRKVIRVEEEEDPKAKSGTSRPSGPAASGDLAQLADQATQPAIKALFRSLAVPYDLVLYKRSNVLNNGERVQREEKIEPTPFYLGEDPDRILSHDRLQFTTYTLDWKPDKKLSPLPGTLTFVCPYEQIAQEKVRQFLRDSTSEGNSDPATSLTQYDKLLAAEKVLSAVILWHKSARLTDRRTGKEWEDVELKLRKQLLDEVLLKQMDELTKAKNWEGVLELTRRLAVTYTKPTERERIFRPVADMIQRALGDDPTATEEKRQQAKQQALIRLHDLEREFPDNAAFRPLADTLRRQAQSYADMAQELLKEKNTKQARVYLTRAQEIYPQLPDLRKLEREINVEHPILRVGMRGPLPKYFSPAWACTENERRAVDLLFESLVKLVPDGTGGYRYDRGLSESQPKVVTLGRQFELPRKAYWSDGRQLNSTDIYVSWTLFRDGKGVGRSRVWGDLLASAESKRDPFQVALQMRQGFLDPLALMTFKIVPRDQQKAPVNDEKFALNPVTSGPFLREGEGSDEQLRQRQCQFFSANPSYRSRPTKNGAPHIQEIRFYTSSNAVEDLSAGKLDLVLDLTATEAQELLQKQNAGLPIEAPLPSQTVPNRRIYFLAINTRKLADAELRQALSYAIDRETLLNKHFRGPLNTRVHKALNGPFPVGSWACNQNGNDAANKVAPKLFKPDAAKFLKDQPSVRQAVKDGPWKLNYPDGDPALADAMKELCAQVKELTGVVLEPKPLTPYQLREDVEVTKKYDLAYYHYDFPDEIYWLAPLFGPPAGTDDDNNNIFKFQNLDLSKLLAGTKSYRDFAMVQKHQWETHELLNRQMPFIPLWQLDPLLAYRREVQPALLDPLLPFSNIEEWRLLRK